MLDVLGSSPLWLSDKLIQIISPFMVFFAADFHQRIKSAKTFNFQLPSRNLHENAQTHDFLIFSSAQNPSSCEKENYLQNVIKLVQICPIQKRHKSLFSLTFRLTKLSERFYDSSHSCIHSSAHFFSSKILSFFCSVIIIKFYFVNFPLGAFSGRF